MLSLVCHTASTNRSLFSSLFVCLFGNEQSFTMMLRDHFEKCNAVPQSLMVRYRQLKNRSAQGACDSKNYWVYAAKKRGLVDTDYGIAITDEAKAEASKMLPFFLDDEESSKALAAKSKNIIMLVKPEDQATSSSPFLYSMMCHVQMVYLLPCEKIGKRKTLPIGLEGFGCRYCVPKGRLGYVGMSTWNEYSWNLVVNLTFVMHSFAISIFLPTGFHATSLCVVEHFQPGLMICMIIFNVVN